MILSFSSRSNDIPIRVIVEEVVQTKVVIKGVERNLRFDEIDLDGQDDKDRIPLREMITRAKPYSSFLFQS